ncbi:MAG: DUF2961 domain-containing protein [Phycisphaerales bacterium]|nr:DUF2961 domain-containing protein [Phycisphaerales bacterium]
MKNTECRNRVLAGSVLFAVCLASAALPPAIDTAAPATQPAAKRPAVDLRPLFEGWNLPVRGQGARGTCSAFVITQALEFARARRTGHGTPLSVEYLNWASNEVAGNKEDGGFFWDLWRGFERLRICTDADLPYRAEFDGSFEPPSELRWRAREFMPERYQYHWIKEWDVNTGLTPEQLAEIKRTLDRQWPVCGGLRWPKAEKWDGDLLEFAPPEGVRDGHSVLLVGYQDDPSLPGGGALLFRNSARPKQDGRMTYAYASAYMNDAAWIDFDAYQETVVEPPALSHMRFAVPLPDEAVKWLSPVSMPPTGRNHRVSSNQRPDWHTENLDMTWLQPGESIDVPLLGPGVITHMWFTSHAGWVGELNALSLRIYWDGSDEPGVEAPLGDFFAVGQGRPAVVNSIPVQVSPTGSLSCYWRMPFHKAARIVIRNDNPDRGAGLYWQIDWTRVKSLPEDTPRFFASYRCEFPAKAGGDYLIADLEGRGLYVGTVMSVTLAQDGWFGERDDFFTINGESTPSLQGTGTEDYFNDAWGFRERTTAWFGQPRWQGDAAGDSGVCYRWHLPDPVNFSSSLKLAIEHKGNRDVDIEAFYIERPDFFSSVAFWYQTGRPKAFPPLPDWKSRRVPWQIAHFVKAFQKVAVEGDAKPKIDTSGLFGARPVLLWPNKTPGATLTIPIGVEQGGRCAVRLVAGSGTDYGTFDIEVDSKRIATRNFRAADPSELDLLLGTHALSNGPHVLTFRASMDAAAVGPLAVEMLRILALPPEANRTVRTHHEAHFVRLAIGRAVYAYRLAYGDLPDSLDTLVARGVLAERYLRDENDQPLTSRREGDFLVVESKGEKGEPWAHRWRGLDPRR